MTEDQTDLNVLPQEIPEGVQEAPEYYANMVRLTTNVYGTTILFGLARPAALTGKVTAGKAVCSMFMSPPQAKTLFLLLRQHLRNYEEDTGKIPVPKEIEEQYGDDLYG